MPIHICLKNGDRDVRCLSKAFRLRYACCRRIKGGYPVPVMREENRVPAFSTANIEE